MNVFLTKDRKIKLGDLGLSTPMQSENIHGNLIGTPLYISPEQIRKQPYGFKIDVWAYGCVLYNMACLFLPFNGNNLQVLYHNIVNEHPKPLNPVFTPRLSRFILRLLEKNSINRPSIFNALTNIPNAIKNEYRHRLSVDGSMPSNQSSLNNSIIADNEEVNKSTIERPSSSRVDLTNGVLCHREKVKSVKITPDLRSVSGLRPSTGFSKNRPSLPFIKQDYISTARNPLIASLEFKRKQIPRPKKTTINDLAKIV
jgi:serine/threonine protein kinase